MTISLTLDQMKRLLKDHFEEFVNQPNAVVVRENHDAGLLRPRWTGRRPGGVDGDEQMTLAGSDSE